jgi:hypothetical protein
VGRKCGKEKKKGNIGRKRDIKEGGCLEYGVGFVRV